MKISLKPGVKKMRATVNSLDPRIDWRAEGDARIAQNAANLLRLWTGETPYMRGMGVDATLAHRPLVTGAGALTAQLRAMLREYEPDAGIIDVRPLHGPDGEVHFEADIDTAEGASG